MTHESPPIDINAAISARVKILQLSYALKSQDKIVLADVLSELALWRAIGETAIQVIERAAADKAQTDVIFDAMLSILEHALPTYKRGENLSVVQSGKAKKSRIKDELASLMDKTYKALQSEGVTVSPRVLIKKLWRYDDSGTLRASTPLDMYGKPNDPKRTYVEGKGQSVFIHWNNNGMARRTSYKLVFERLKTIRERPSE